MDTTAQVTLEHAYRVGDKIYARVDGVPYLVDSGAEVSMTRRALSPKGKLKVQWADASITEVPYGIWKGAIWILGAYDRITIADLEKLHQKPANRGKVEERLKILQARLVKLPVVEDWAERAWYKAVNIPEVTEQKIKESDLSPEGKLHLREIISKANVARFKNDCGDLGPKYIHTSDGGSLHSP